MADGQAELASGMRHARAPSELALAAPVKGFEVARKEWVGGFRLVPAKMQ